MSADDRERRTARLTAAAAARTTDATARARRAITRLRNTGQPVTFVDVARDAGCIDQLPLPAQPTTRRHHQPPHHHDHHGDGRNRARGKPGIATHQTRHRDRPQP